MRVIAGTARSLRLLAPKGQGTRPTTDRIKETLFNMIQPYLADCIFVDLFSGSGGIGIEALSRGAKKAWFVENDAAACFCIQQNLKNTGLEGRAVTLRQDVSGALSLIREKEVDIVFMDPPYEAGLVQKVLEGLAGSDYISEHTMVIVETLRDTDLSYAEAIGYKITKEKRYKTNKHVFLEKTEVGMPGRESNENRRAGVQL